jgi:hypothetical protein
MQLDCCKDISVHVSTCTCCKDISMHVSTCTSYDFNTLMPVECELWR